MRTTVVGAIVVHDGRVLAARRSRPPELAGRWEFPGGKVEPDEDVRGALVREVREELGAVIAVGEELSGGGVAWPISAELELRLFLATVVEGELQPGPDHDALRWVDPDEVAAVDWLPSDRLALPALVERLWGG